MLCYSSEWIHYVKKHLVLNFSEEIRDVSLENVKEIKFVSDFPKVKPKQNRVFSISKQDGRNLEMTNHGIIALKRIFFLALRLECDLCPDHDRLCHYFFNYKSNSQWLHYCYNSVSDPFSRPATSFT